MDVSEDERLHIIVQPPAVKGRHLSAGADPVTNEILLWCMSGILKRCRETSVNEKVGKEPRYKKKMDYQ